MEETAVSCARNMDLEIAGGGTYCTKIPVTTAELQMLLQVLRALMRTLQHTGEKVSAHLGNVLESIYRITGTSQRRVTCGDTNSKPIPIKKFPSA